LTHRQFLAHLHHGSSEGHSVTQSGAKAYDRVRLVNQNGQQIGAKGQRTRQRLIEVTLSLLETHGLRDLTVAHVARGAAMSSATFYVYFEGVPEVVLAALDDSSQWSPALRALLESEWCREDGLAHARALVSLYCEQWATHATIFRVRNLASEEGDVRFLAARRQAVAPILEALTRKIDSARFAKRLSPTGDSRASAAAILMLLERLAAIGPQGLIDGGPGFDNIKQAAADMIGHALGMD
jgi:AcrR family transcriptional regulator